jgi:adenine-specific DNA-methyltransferase
LLNFYYQHFLKSTKKVFSEIQARQVAQLPIPTLETIPEKTKVRLVELVDQMLIAQASLRDVSTDLDRQRVAQHVSILDAQIDKAVYELYGLTEEEIRIVETG